MTGIRFRNSIALVLNGLAIAAALLDYPRIAAIELALSISLLVWNLERFRVHLTREQR